ncbi:response regulator transcription factor [Citrobacter gillenii]|uniref:Response regulator transcription factor n=1 Tax=Citrobacter gillenii TaxID=67828 RepID=A0ABD6MH74_9ENTR|nr:response regulator transcription factor [Citrobacter gillenii]NTZ52943.1 response regulator transcription factor [Citrobacter gillenii]
MYSGHHGINVAIADDHPALLIGIKHELAANRMLNIIGAASDSTQLISILDEHECDVIVTDYAMPGGKYGDGTSLLTFIKRRYPNIKIVVFTMLDNPAIISDLLRNDINCILSKSDPVQHIAYAIRAAYSEKKYFSPATDEIVKRLNVNPDKIDYLYGLSKREIEVIRMYVAGYTINQIAEKLSRSKQTISAQKQNAMKKLGAINEPDLIKVAIEIGLL